jgi:hypothetical protein
MEERGSNSVSEKSMKSKRVIIFAARSLALALLIGTTTGVGVYVGNRLAQDRQIQNMPPIELKAGTSARTKSMSMATGLIEPNVEGLYVLDHLTGNLQCWLLNNRTGQVGGIYRASAATDLAVGGGKAGKPEYMMTTGNFFFQGGLPGNDAPSQSVCYVGDASTGNVVGYGVVYNKQAVQRGMVQQGFLKVVCKGSARSGAQTTRDQ